MSVPNAGPRLNDQLPIPSHRSVKCPACNALPGELCTAPTVDGRRPVQWVHNSRRDLAEGWS